MKVLVTGSNGFLGVVLVETLLARGEKDLRCFVRPGNRVNHLESMTAKHAGAKVEIFVGNLGVEADADRALAEVDVIYHLAAALRGAPADMFKSSVAYSQRLLEAMARTGRKIRVVLISSIGVYGASDVPRGTIITEETPVDPHPEKRDVYSHAKVWQEKVFWEARSRQGFPMVVVRPGVIYGAGGTPIASRVGMELFGFFLNLGGKNPLPLTYVENCAAAIVVAGRRGGDGEVYNVHDDDLPTCDEYLWRYRREVRRLRTIRLPYFALYLLSKLLERYAVWSEGQLPPVFTPYKVSAMWKKVDYDNSKLKHLGWRQPVPTEEALSRTFAGLRARGL